jgi:hypothetical protein
MKGLLQADLIGPALLSGGAAGVEASIFALVVVIAASVCLVTKAQL